MRSCRRSSAAGRIYWTARGHPRTLTDRLRDRGFITAEEMAHELGLCLSQVHNLGREGILPRQRYGNEQRCLYAPINGAVLVRGRGGRYRSRRPALIPAPTSTQETV